jgi:hypothetical protein
MNTNMKISSVALLLAGVTGASVAYAADPLTNGFQKDSQAVAVEITGTIVTTATKGCSAASARRLVFDMGNSDGATEWTKEASGEEFTLSRVAAGNIEITCDADTTTEITFRTNNDFSEDTSENQYSSWPVVIVPNFPSGGAENLSESRINGYLAGVTCNQGECTSISSNLNRSSITSDNSGVNVGAQTITAEIEGQLYSAAAAYGNVQGSPRSGAPELYVIYDGNSSSQIPIDGLRDLEENPPG